MTAIHERVWTALAFQGVVRLAGLMAFLLLPLAVCLQTWRQGLWRLAGGFNLATAF
jgi:hypothetical protein